MQQLFGKQIPAKKILIAGAGYGETFYTPSVQSLFDLAIEFERRSVEHSEPTVSLSGQDSTTPPLMRADGRSGELRL